MGWLPAASSSTSRSRSGVLQALREALPRILRAFGKALAAGRRPVSSSTVINRAVPTAETRLVLMTASTIKALAERASSSKPAKAKLAREKNHRDSRPPTSFWGAYRRSRVSVESSLSCPAPW